MILVFDDTNIRRKFEKELKNAVICHSVDSEVFGNEVSGEDYVNQMIVGASIPFYREIFRKNVAKCAVEHEVVILDCDLSIPDGVEKCPVIYITERTVGNDDEFGQLPVKYLGNVETTVQKAKDTISQWLQTYGEQHSEKYFYEEFYKVSAEKVPTKIRLVAIERIQSEYAAQVVVDFDDEHIEEIKACIEKTEREAGCKVFVDERITDYFKIEDNYYITIDAEDMDSFVELAKSLEERNNSLIRDMECVRKTIEKNLDEWKHRIYNEIYLKHNASEYDYVKIPAGYFQIYYNSAYIELHLQKIGIEEEKDDVVFLSKVIDFLEKELSSLGGKVKVGMYFYGKEKLEDMLQKSK